MTNFTAKVAGSSGQRTTTAIKANAVDTRHVRLPNRNSMRKEYQKRGHYGQRCSLMTGAANGPLAFRCR